MKTSIQNRIRGLYFYYSSGATSRIPYFSTISALVIMLFLHFLQVGIILHRLFDVQIDILPLPDDGPRIMKYVFIALYFAPIYFGLTLFFKKADLDQPIRDLSEMHKYRNQFFIYALANGCLTILLILDKIVFRK